MHRFGDVILSQVQFTDTYELKLRPALVLFEEKQNIVVAGITSNTNMQGISIKKSEGAVKDSVIKLNYVFTISEKMVQKQLFHLSSEKKNIVRTEFLKKLK